ncbi:MAG TPA: rhodanese-like domain-containing protein [Pyrinomonadaceae bacterium]|jgi:hypothetical protein|nr:rhodanese-like domain-containing protein [Pyrinomonadaceae bacterium]
MRRQGLLAAFVICAAAIFFAACKADDGAGNARSSSDNNSTAATRNASNVAANNGATLGGAPSTGPSAPSDGVRRIGVGEARSAADRGEAVILDVRSKAEFDRGHIKGALSFPKSELQTRAAQLPRNKLLIAYCA